MQKKKTKAPKKKSTITLTIRAHEKREVDIIENIAKVVDEKTFSGALMKAAELLPKEIQRSKKLLEENMKLRESLSVMSEVVMDWLDSQNKLVQLKKSIESASKIKKAYEVGGE